MLVTFENKISGDGRNFVTYFALNKSSFYQRLKLTTFALMHYAMDCRDKYQAKGERDYIRVEPLPDVLILTETSLYGNLAPKAW